MAIDGKPRTGARKSAAITLREAIEKAEKDGVARADMTLRLSHRDAADLKRDRSVAVEDIGFKDGAMSYLGVKVAPEPAASSGLDIDGAA
jgi:hypothetical protein